MKIKKGDIIISISLLVISILMAFTISNNNIEKINNNTSKLLRVEKNSKLLYELPLDEDREIVLQDNNKYNKIIIKDGKVYMKEANCRDQICVHMHPIKEMGETIICLPNQVFLEIIDPNSDTNNDIDKVVR